MDDTDTATVELSQGEAREILNALADHEARTRGGEADRALNLRSLIEREFGFEDEPAAGDETIVDDVLAIFDDRDGSHEIQLSRAEAVEVYEALGETADPDRPDAETVADLRSRLAERFDLDRP